jgi:XRE family transcriptional regulator, regulator of sulfur utilization
MNDTLQSMIYEWTKLDVESTKVGARRAIFRGATGTLNEMSCHSTTLNPGEVAHPPHQHPEEEMILLKEGTLEAIINDTKQTMSAGSILFLAPNDFHGVRNVGTTQATYYVLKWWP